MRARSFFSIALLLGALSWIGAGAAGDSRPAAGGHHSLWKIEGKTNTVYLLGSIHVFKAENYPLPASIEAAYRHSPVVVFEADEEEFQDPATRFRFKSKVTLPEGLKLKDVLSPAVYAEFKQHVEDAGYSMQQFEDLKPATAVLKFQAIALKKLGFDPEFGLDKHFSDLARAEKKQIIALETADFQMNLLTDFAGDEAESMIKATLEDIDQTRKFFGEIVAAWETGDAGKLEELLNGAEQQKPAIYKRLVTDRSRAWLPKIEELIRGGKNAIVIVGAAHLVGNEGVVELLKKKGFKVTQL